MEISIPIKVLALAGSHVAVAELGGFRIRGLRAEKPADAVRNLLWKLSGKSGDHDDDALFAIELACAGTSIDEQLKLPDGGEQSAPE